MDRSAVYDDHDDHDDNNNKYAGEFSQSSMRLPSKTKSKPRSDETINLKSTRKVMQDVHHEQLDGKSWDDLEPKIACTTILNAIKDGVKHICHSINEDCRYKFIVQTFISKLNLQCTMVKSRCLWDAKTDRLVFENYNNGHVICSSQVIFIYFY